MWSYVPSKKAFVIWTLMSRKDKLKNPTYLEVILSICAFSESRAYSPNTNACRISINMELSQIKDRLVKKIKYDFKYYFQSVLNHPAP